MENYIVEGGNRLEGEVVISGAKNAALPIIAATILNPEKIEIDNCPNIHDVAIMLNILEILGCKVHMEKNQMLVDTSDINQYEIPENLMREMRSSVIIVGAMLGRMKKCVFTYPGDCDF
ncbi:MAG: UDP-N-acetylglucosamine 1-carboxyvinyltransferase [Clostridia bacterium]|nr:UDP-N-acetylglucosamine 1-carboxyvinyltransferase [Clostridia bacterium]